MLRISDNRLDYFISEDVPYVDLTSLVLGIDNAPGEMEYFSREACVVAGVDEVARLAKNAGCEVEVLHESGDCIVPDEPILRVRGTAGSLHQVWKVGLNLLDHLSAVATKTRSMVDAVHEVNPHCEVLTTRKSMPGCKDLLVEAVMVGGAFPHRLGLSETVLVFDHHMKFLGGFDEFVKRIPEFRSRCIEKKLFVEATADQARVLAEAGVDGIQFDKVPRRTHVAGRGAACRQSVRYAHSSRWHQSQKRCCIRRDGRRRPRHNSAFRCQAPRHERAHDRAVITLGQHTGS